MQPRLFTPELRELTRETSYGFRVIDFARDVLGEPLDPWQAWAVIHAGELLEDGRPRFRQILILVARQNGKTHLLKVLALFWLFVERQKLIVGMSTNLEYAKEAWSAAVAIAETNEYLSEMMPARGGVLRGNNDVHMKTIEGCKYKIAASNRKGGRSLTIDRLIIDEVREHHDFTAVNAAMPAMSAREYAQAFLISNQGDDKSVVLDSLRDSALEFIKSGEGDYRLGLLEWSAPDGSDVEDPAAHAAANPNLGRRISAEDIAGPAKRAKAAGGEELGGFKTEILCMRVKSLDAAIDPQAWEDCKEPGDIADIPGANVAMVLDVSPNRQHATLVAAAKMPDGRVRVVPVMAWSGITALKDARAALPNLVTRAAGVRTFGWVPNGPAAALAADLADRKGVRSWPPAGITVEEIRGEVSAICMGLAAMVDAREVVHSDEPLLTTHIISSAKLWSGDVWRFSRQGEGSCDAAYAAAGAIHLARTMPTPIGKPRFITAED